MEEFQSDLTSLDRDKRSIFLYSAFRYRYHKVGLYQQLFRVFNLPISSVVCIELLTLFQAYNTKEIPIYVNDDVDKLREMSTFPGFWSTEIDVAMLHREKTTIFFQQGLGPLSRDYTFKRRADFAARIGSLKCFKFSLLNQPNCSYDSKLLHHAIAGGNIEIIQQVLEMNIQLDHDCLFFAIACHQTQILNWLIDVQEMYTKANHLHCALWAQNYASFAILVEKGTFNCCPRLLSDLNELQADEMFLYLFEHEREKIESHKLYSEHPLVMYWMGEDINKCLQAALQQPQFPHCIEFCLQNGAVFDQKSWELCEGISKNSTEIGRLLVKMGSGISFPLFTKMCFFRESSGLYFTAIDEDLVMSLIAQQRDINEQDSVGNTALHYAVMSDSSLRRIKLYVKLGADLTIKNKQDETPISIIPNRCSNAQGRIRDFLCSQVSEEETSLEKRCLIF